MAEKRIAHAVRNASWSFIGRFVMIGNTFLVKTVMIHTMGAEYLGVNSLFTSVLRILSLAELGFTSAIVYSMYKPIAFHDTDMVCALLKLFRKIYWYIGSSILLLGIGILPFLNKLVSGTTPDDTDFHLIFCIYLMNTVCSYWFGGYKGVILIAQQRNDIAAKISLRMELAKGGFQMLVLLLFRNYYLYAAALPVSTIITNLITARMADRFFPQYVCRGQVDKECRKEIIKKAKALLAVKITALIYNSVDSIVISGFLGLVALAKYNNYYFVMNSVAGILTVIYGSVQSSVGNSIILETPEKNYRDYRNLSYINAWLVGWCTVCLFCLYQPFIRIWAGEEFVLDRNIMICFCIYFYVHQLKTVQSTYKDAAGLWREDLWRSYCANLFNLVTNVILIQKIGLYGVLISTILALLVITYPWQTRMLHKKLFQCSMAPFIKSLLEYAAATAGACVLTEWVCSICSWEGIGELLGRGILCIIVPNCLFLLLSLKREEFAVLKKTLKNMAASLKEGRNEKR